MRDKPVTPLRRRMIEDMALRKFGEKTQADYIRHVERFARFLGRPLLALFAHRTENRFPLFGPTR